MFKEIASFFHPIIPKEVMQETDIALKIIIAEPLVKEVRLFGSSIKGRWDHKKSDIDLAVIIKGNDTEWSAYNRSVVDLDFDADGKPICITGETKIRQSFRQLVKNIAPRVEIHIATDADIELMRKEGGILERAGLIENFHKVMLKGKLLYSQNPMV